ncbi:Uma2 family endonuclease [Actinosynnema sp. NPDC053489]|uniref:Uma2 family endonuclease n=1 Tax=Actinosynnema sp. NPDC053489 TaxID=3363916 RepID=UPI0037C92B60
MTVMAHDHGGRPYTVEDLEGMPDDGRRYELIDGTLLVGPAPGARHQRVVARLVVVMEQACPDDLLVFPAPFAVRTSATNELQPDLLVTRLEDVTEKLLPVAPLLAVEVLSPSTALNDFNSKKAAYERLGVPAYWVIDPREPKLIAFELDAAGRYEQVAEVKGEDQFDAVLPFPVRVVPVELLGTLRDRPLE